MQLNLFFIEFCLEMVKKQGIDFEILPFNLIDLFISIRSDFSLKFDYFYIDIDHKIIQLQPHFGN